MREEENELPFIPILGMQMSTVLSLHVSSVQDRELPSKIVRNFL